MKDINGHFADWEGGVFGYGYGSGEPHVLQALQTFLREVEPDGQYDYRKLETACTAPVAWLLINALVRANIIEYGSSPRFGWLTRQGKALRHFVCERPAEALEDAIARNTERGCYRDHCNCSDGDCRSDNVFW